MPPGFDLFWKRQLDVLSSLYTISMPIYPRITLFTNLPNESEPRMSEHRPLSDYKVGDKVRIHQPARGWVNSVVHIREETLLGDGTIFVRVRVPIDGCHWPNQDRIMCAGEFAVGEEVETIFRGRGAVIAKEFVDDKPRYEIQFALSRGWYEAHNVIAHVPEPVPVPVVGMRVRYKGKTSPPVNMQQGQIGVISAVPCLADAKEFWVTLNDKSCSTIFGLTTFADWEVVSEPDLAAQVADLTKKLAEVTTVQEAQHAALGKCAVHVDVLAGKLAKVTAERDQCSTAASLSRVRCDTLKADLDRVMSERDATRADRDKYWSLAQSAVKYSADYLALKVELEKAVAERDKLVETLAKIRTLT